MPKVRLDVGATVDFLNKDELDDVLSKNQDRARAAEYEKLRGVKYLRMPRLYGTPSSGTVGLGTMPPMTGPAQGYAWSIRRLSANGLGTGNSPDLLNIYRNGTNSDPVWQLNGNSWSYTFGRGEFILLPGEFLQAASIASLVSTTVITLAGDVVEVPSEFLGKLVG